MPLPSLEQYLAVIEQKQPASFSHLNDYHFESAGEGTSRRLDFRTGTSAAVFRASKGGKHYAVRVFLRDEPALFKRYYQISSALSRKNFSWKVDFLYFEKEILVNDQRYPVVLMDWAEGLHLNQFIDEVVFQQSVLSKLQEKLVAISNEFENEGIGHGDLKFDNILIQRQGDDFSIKLVDYDSMYVPEMAGERNIEPGSPGFQHPRRLASHFSETVDRFSIWVMLTALEAIKVEPELWTNPERTGFNPSRNLLFTFRDLISPGSSRLFQVLKELKSDALPFYTDQLIRFCQIQHLDSIDKPVLFGGAKTQPVRSKPIEKEQPQPAETAVAFEIKSVPAGKDILVRGLKKGITPSRITIMPAEFDAVVIADGNEQVKVPVTPGIFSYEVTLPRKETPLPAPPTEADEILEFDADRYTASEGDLATIKWRVKGNGKIHISNIGEVAEKTGRKRVVLNATTNYELTIGSKKRSITIKVQPRPAEPVTAPPQPVDRPPAEVLPPQPKARKRWPMLFGLVMILGIAGYAGFRALNNKNAVATENLPQVNKAQLNPGAGAETTVFTNEKVTDFLKSLYAAYNKRDLVAILNHYAPRLNLYYDSKSVGQDSLISIIDDLFLTPAAYQCTPDFGTLRIEPQEKNCRVTITISEKLRYDNSSSPEQYKSTIEYLVDPQFKILSEKHGT